MFNLKYKSLQIIMFWLYFVVLKKIYYFDVLTDILVKDLIDLNCGESFDIKFNVNIFEMCWIATLSLHVWLQIYLNTWHKSLNRNNLKYILIYHQWLSVHSAVHVNHISKTIE